MSLSPNFFSAVLEFLLWKKAWAIIPVLFCSLLFASQGHTGDAVVSWNPNSEPDLAGYKLYYGTSSGNYNNIINVPNVNTTYTVTNLANGTYYFALTAYDTSGNESGYSNEVSKTIVNTDTTPPLISGVTVNSITSSGVTIAWSTDEAATSQVEYGTTISYGSSTALDSTLQTSHTVTLTGLSALVSYHFRVKSQDSSGNQSMSSDLTFTTLTPPDITPPTGTISISNGAIFTASTTVTLNLSCSDAGSGCTQMQFSNDAVAWSAWESYAATKSWTLTTGNGSKTVSVRYQDNSANISSTYSDLITFDNTSPTVSGIAAGNLTATGATITWTTEEASTTQVEYGTTTAYGTSSTLNSSLVTSHSVTLGNLTASTLYHYRVKSTDGAGNQAVSGDFTFTTTTVPDATAPTISGISAANITENGATINWVTNEPATAQVEYGTSSTLGSLSPKDSSLSTSHSIVLSGLNPNTTYHFKAASADGAGNSATSIENIFATLQSAQPDQPAAVSDLGIQAGTSARNSVILEWTATGADGTSGTATRYDLRMSKFKIVDDGNAPGSGEINFSSATSVGGIPVPQSSGTLQSVQITGLETNTVYYFAVKAVDDKNLMSPLSNVVNSGNSPPLPVTALRLGYTMVSFPMLPASTDTQTLLGNVVGTPVEIYWWNSSGQEDGSGSFVRENQIVPGYGYFLKSNQDNSVLNVIGIPVTDASRAIPIVTGWNIIGNPYSAEVTLTDTQVRDLNTGEVKTFEQAVIAGWIGNALYRYNGSTYTFVPYLQAKLELWQGYWLAVIQSGTYELIITRP